CSSLSSAVMISFTCGSVSGPKMLSGGWANVTRPYGGERRVRGILLVFVGASFLLFIFFLLFSSLILSFGCFLRHFRHAALWGGPTYGNSAIRSPWGPTLSPVTFPFVRIVTNESKTSSVSVRPLSGEAGREGL